MRLFVSLTLLCLLLGCARDRASSAEVVRPTPPADQATAEERLAIDSSLSRIELLTAELGQPKKFRDVPVLVVANDDNSITANPGACVSLAGDPQFIVMKHKVLTAEKSRGENAVMGTLFSVLLHEIGHCYLKRPHDESLIQDPRGRIAVSFRRENHEQEAEFSSLHASIMASDSLEVPVELEKYYVAELLGLDRARSPEDFRRYAKTRVISQKNLSER